jgi:hypothetical protein
MCALSSGQLRQWNGILRAVSALGLEDLNPVQLKIQYRILYSDFWDFTPKVWMLSL